MHGGRADLVRVQADWGLLMQTLAYLAGVVGLLSDYVFNYETGIAPSLALVCFTGGVIGLVLVTLGRAAFRIAVQRAANWGEGT